MKINPPANKTKNRKVGFFSKPVRREISNKFPNTIEIQTEAVQVMLDLAQIERSCLASTDAPVGFGHLPIGLSCEVHDGEAVQRLCLADFEARTFEITDVEEGLCRGFRQWTLTADCKVRPEIVLRLHVVARRGERSLRIEPELCNQGSQNLELSDLRIHVGIAKEKGVFAEFIGGRPEYIGNKGGSSYVVPFASHSVRLPVGDLVSGVPLNCGHLILNKGKAVFAAWHPAGHNSNCGGRSQYVHMPVTVHVEDEKVQLSIPFYQPLFGTDFTAKIPLQPGLPHRVLGIVLALGQIEQADPWEVVRRARADAMTRGPKRKRPLPMVSWGTWMWPKRGPEVYTPLELSNFVRQPAKSYPQEAFIGAEGCREWVVKANLPHLKDLGCEMVWLDLLPIYMGTFLPVTERFPTGLKRLRRELKDLGLSLSCILVHDHRYYGDWTPALESRFGRYRHSTQTEFMCWASPWAGYAAKKIARVAEDYELGSAQIAFNHNQFLLPPNGCNAAGHGHIPCENNVMDYARKYLESFNALYEAIYRQYPSTFVLENLPSVYDLGNPMPDAMWVADCYHLPQMMWLMLDYMAAQRRLWPMEMCFQNYLSVNYEPSDRSTYLVANIALGNALTIGMDLRFMETELRAFYARWINFYRVHREWLCGNIRIFDRFTIGHALPGQFLVFLFNENEAEREMTVSFRPEDFGPPTGKLAVVEDSAGEWKFLGFVNDQRRSMTWKHRVGSYDFAVLRFCVLTDKVTPIAATAIQSTVRQKGGYFHGEYQPLSGDSPARACFLMSDPPVWIRVNDIPLPFACDDSGLVSVNLPNELCRVVISTRQEDASLTRRARVEIKTSPIDGVQFSDDGHRAESLVDGVYGRQGCWKSRDQGKGWVEIDLGQEQKFAEIVWSRDRTGAFLDSIPRDYEIEVSGVKRCWKTVVRTKGNTIGTGVRHTFPPILGRFLRFKILHTVDRSAPALDEIEVFQARRAQNLLQRLPAQRHRVRLQRIPEIAMK